MSELTEAAIKKLKVTELKAELSKRGLAVKGKKDELTKRLTKAILQQDDSAADDIDESVSQVSSSADTEEHDESADTSQTLVTDDAEEPEKETNHEKEQEETTTELKTKEDNQKSDDWVMVEPPTKEEEESAAAATAQYDAAVQEAAVTQESAEIPAAESTTSIEQETVATEDVEMKEDIAVKLDSEADQSTDNKTDDKKKEDADKAEADKKAEADMKAEIEKKKIPDIMVEVEEEEGEYAEMIEIEDGHVGLDGYTSDLNFIITDSGLSGHNLVKNGFSYMWAGARSNKGAKGGKIGYEVKITKALEVDLVEKEAPIHAVRVGWSVENSTLQLGESALSYGYESTGKVCASSSFFAYGETFGEGDVIGTYLDLESETKTLRYTKNGVDLGVAMSLNLNLDEKPLFPHVFIRNMKVELNFGALDEPWFAALDEYALLQNAGEQNIADKTYHAPGSDEQCEILLLVGLPNSGKSTWAKSYVETHADKRFNIIGVNEVLERCKLEGKRRRRSDDGHEKLMEAVIKVLTKQYQLCPKKRRNYIYDQNNIYEISQNTKMQLFDGFKKKAVVVVPTHDNLRRRSSDAKRKGDNIHDVPFGDLCDMKCEFHLPVVGELFDEIVFPELDEKNASKTIRDYKSDGTRAKRTGRDEYYPSKRPRQEGGRNRDRYSGGNKRDEGWKNSGSGYGDGYKGRDTHSSGNRNNQYQDPYRRSGGGGHRGYRQNQSYGGSSGGNYGSAGGYNTGSSYGGGYGSYGASGGYGSSGYGSTGNYNYGSYNQTNTAAPSAGTWSQYGSGQYSQQQPTQNNQWGSSNTSNQWGGYNYNSGSGNSYGGSGYSY